MEAWQEFKALPWLQIWSILGPIVGAGVAAIWNWSREVRREKREDRRERERADRENERIEMMHQHEIRKLHESDLTSRLGSRYTVAQSAVIETFSMEDRYSTARQKLVTAAHNTGVYTPAQIAKIEAEQLSSRARFEKAVSTADLIFPEQFSLLIAKYKHDVHMYASINLTSTTDADRDELIDQLTNSRQALRVAARQYLEGLYQSRIGDGNVPITNPQDTQSAPEP